MINSDRKKKISQFIIGSIAVILFMIPANVVAQQAESGLAETFIRPEINSNQKAWTRWWWMGNAVTKEGITTHLEKMADVNIGGVEISPIYGVDGYEDASVEYLSPEWMELLSHTVEEANRLGMQVDMITGTGWPFGGSHVNTEDAARRLVVEMYQLNAGEQMEQRVRRVNERNSTAADLHILKGYSSEGETIDLTEYVDNSGELNWIPDNDSGNWHLIAFFNDWTNQQVKRSAPGAGGHVMDHFSDRALENYLDPFNDAFERYNNGMVRSFFNDSYEVERANWTYDFFDKFEEFRNYDLRNYLDVFTGIRQATRESDSAGIPEEEMASRVRADFHETIHDLALNRFVNPWVDWTHSKGSLSRIQAHGFPANILDVYGTADIPEMEIFGQGQFNIPGLRTNPAVSNRTDSPNPLVLKFASSAAHVTGKKLASSETATWLDEHFMVSLSQLRPHVDMQFIAGINHTIYHGSTYSPPDETWPGWKFYASTHFAPSNTFWDDFGDFNRYLANSQSFLQSGSPGNDILLYFPVHDLWHQAEQDVYFIRVHNPDEWFYGTEFGDISERLWNDGYAFDYISDSQISGLEIEDQLLKTGNGSYKAVLVPPVKYLPLDTLKKFFEIAESGGTILFTEDIPESVPGFYNLAERQQEFEELLSSVDYETAGSSIFSEAKTGSGRILLGENISDMLEHAEIRREPVKDTGMDYIRRNHGDGYIYFITNLQGNEVDEWVELGTPAESVVIFDPLSERYGIASHRSSTDGISEVYLQLKPGESRILQTYHSKISDGELWNYYQTDGQAVIVEGEWDVNFIKGGPELPAGYTTSQLESWTDLNDPDARRFAGTARYRINIELPDYAADSWRLDLGRVAESARVSLNGQEIGVVWSHPFEIDLPEELLVPGENQLEIEVTNLMINRIIDVDRRGIHWRKFHDINMVNINYQPFDASEWEPMDSGLLGPVSLVPLKKIN